MGINGDGEMGLGFVTDCDTTGCRSAGTDQGVGGLVGSNSGTVTQCYSTCVVSGTEDLYRRVGGQ